MSRILILYGTTDGHTGKIAGALRETLRQEGCRVDAVDAAAATPATRPEEYDGVLVVSPVRGEKYLPVVKRWVRTHAAVLNRTPSAFVSSCLAVLSHRPEAQRRLEEILDQFARDTGWRPGATKIVAGALPYTRYNWFVRWIMKRIVAKAGGDTDTSRDYEYTDWTALGAFGQEFARRNGLSAAVPAVTA